MNRIRQFAGQTITYGLGHILSRILFFLLITVYLTYRLKDSYQYGIYTDLYAYVSILLVLFSMRLDTALFRFGAKSQNNPAAFGSALVAVFLSAVFVVSVGFLFDNKIASLLYYPESPHYVRWFSIILAFDILSLLPYAKLRLENKAAFFVYCKIFNVVFTVSLVLLFLELLPKEAFGKGVLSFIPLYRFEIDYVFLANLISSIAVFLVLLFSLRSTKFYFNSPLLKKMLYYSFPLIVVGICGSFNQYFAVPLQKFFLGEDVISNISSGGTYGASQKIASIFLLFTTAFNYAAEPFFFNNASEEDRNNLYGKICRLFVLIGGIIVLAIYLGIDLFKFLIDSSLREAIFVVPILLLAYLLLGIYYNISIWYKLSDKTIYGAFISFIGVIITSIISIVYLPKFGYSVSAWAALATFFTMVILAYFLGQKHFPIDYPVKKISFNIIIVLGIMALSYFANTCFMPTVFYSLNALLFVAYLIYTWKVERTQWLSILIKDKSTDSL